MKTKERKNVTQSDQFVVLNKQAHKMSFILFGMIITYWIDDQMVHLLSSFFHTVNLRVCFCSFQSFYYWDWLHQLNTLHSRACGISIYAEYIFIIIHNKKNHCIRVNWSHTTINTEGENWKQFLSIPVFKFWN